MELCHCVFLRLLLLLSSETIAPPLQDGQSIVVIRDNGGKLCFLRPRRVQSQFNFVGFSIVMHKTGGGFVFHGHVGPLCPAATGYTKCLSLHWMGKWCCYFVRLECSWRQSTTSPINSLAKSNVDEEHEKWHHTYVLSDSAPHTRHPSSHHSGHNCSKPK